MAEKGLQWGRLPQMSEGFAGSSATTDEKDFLVIPREYPAQAWRKCKCITQRFGRAEQGHHTVECSMEMRGGVKHLS